MPKLDFFSGQPDDEAKASKEASGASGSGDNWDDAFAGMQKLDLFEDDPQEVSVPEAAAPDVTQVFSVPETPVAAAQEPASQAMDQKEAVGKSVFESLFADEDFEEEEPARPAKGGLFGSRGKAKKEAQAPAFAGLFDDDPEEDAPAAPAPLTEVAPVTLAAEPAPQPAPEPSPAAEPVTISVAPPAPAAEPAPQPAAVPVFSEEKMPESEPAPSRSPSGRVKPIDWHADLLSRIQPTQTVQPAAMPGGPAAPSVPQPVTPLEEPAWKPILESAMMERSEEPADYTADEAATRTFVPGGMPEPAASARQEPAPVVPRHAVDQPDTLGSLFDSDPEEPQHSAKDIASNIAASFEGGEEDLFGGFDDFGAAPVQPAPVQPQDATSDDIFGGGLYDADPDADDGDFGEEPPPRAPRARRVQDYPGGGGNKKIGMFVAIAVVVLALLVAVYFLFFNKKDQKEPVSSVPTPPASVSASASAPGEASSAPEEPALEAIPRNEWYLQLVNREHALDASYAPELGTVDGQQLDARVVEPMNQMIAAAKNDGITLKLMAGYRSYERQKASYEKGTTDCPPGASEHNLGMSADIMSTEDTSYDAATFEKTKAFAWLQEHAAEYGFILRYPSDKKDVTGFDYEPWHYRYVGSEQAAKIKASGLTLEEYLAQPNPTA